MEQNKEQKPTIEEVLKKHSGLLLIRAGVNEYAKAAAIEWASIETEQLRQENKTLKEQQRTLHVEVNSDSLAVAHYEKEIAALQQRIKELESQIK